MDSRDLRNLSEAWAAATLCEDLCIEWAQKKLAEGFDFSQYTEEEIIEQVSDEILSEQPQRGSGMRNAPANRAAQQFGGFVNFLRNLGSQGPMQGSRSRFNRPRSTTTQYGADLLKSQETPATPVRPAAPVRPTATADTAPAKPAGAAVADKVTPAAPARRSIAQDLADLRAMRMRSQDRIIAQGGKPATGRVPGADKNLKDANRAARQYLRQDADIFDIVKGYLLDEGATEEEALKRMSVMSEEERNEIIESSCGGGHSKKKKKKSGY